jgi:hypothetical protein
MQLLALGGLGDGQIERNREVEPAGGGLLSGLVGLKGEGGGGLRGDHADGLAEGGGGGGLEGGLEHGGLLGLGLGFLLAAGLLAEGGHLGLELHARHQGHNVQHVERV